MAVDGLGNVYVTGPRGLPLTFAEDYVTIKYDTNGNELWVAAYDGPGTMDDVSNAIALDASGNVYVTGRSVGLGGEIDYATIKYDAEGTQLWVARYGGGGDEGYQAFSVVTDASGNVYITGQSEQDIGTVKYDTDGNELWAARYDGPGKGEDGATAIAVDTSGNVYVVGYSTGDGTAEDYTTIKHDPSGSELWVGRKDGTGRQANAYFRGMAVDTAGNSYVSHVRLPGDGNCFIGIVKYDQDGHQLWVAQDEETDCNSPVRLKVDNANNVYVGGVAGRTTLTIKYDTDGNRLWEARYWGPPPTLWTDLKR
jgi:hypothetical protein